MDKVIALHTNYEGRVVAYWHNAKGEAKQETYHDWKHAVKVFGVTHRLPNGARKVVLLDGVEVR